MLQYLPWAAGILGALSILLFAQGFRLVTADQQVTGGIPRKGSKETTNKFILSRLSESIGRPFTGTVLGLLGGHRPGIRRRIAAAGHRGDMTVETYAARKAGDFLLYSVPALLLIIGGHTFIGTVALPLGLFLADIQLFADGRSRQDQIQRKLPDFLDVLAVTVSAGLGFRHALSRVSDSMPGPLAEEFQTALSQMELGASRREAFEDLRQRNSSEAVGQFVTALLQAEELGAPLSQALVEISTDMRRASSQWAKRRAQRINPQITVVIMLTIMPGLLLLAVGAMLLGSDLDFGKLGGA